MTYANTTLLGLNQPTTGSESGVWGDDINNGTTQLIEVSIVGSNTISYDGNVTLSVSNGSNASSFGSTTTTSTSSGVAQYPTLILTGARTALRTITAPSSSRIYRVINQTTGGYNTIVNGSATTGVSIPPGASATLIWNGSDFQGVSTVVGNLTFTDTNILASFQTSVNTYSQIVNQNSNSGATASADFIVGNNNTTATTYYGDFGMNSSGFTGSGAFNAANAVYLTSTSGDLAIGTTTSNAIHFVVNSGTTDAMAISSSGTVTIGGSSITLGGNFTTSGAYTTTITMTGNTTATFPTSGYHIATVTNMANNPVTGTPSSSNFLRGDGTWATPSGTFPSPYTANGVVYASSTSALATGSALTFDGTNLGVGGAALSLPAGYTVSQVSGTSGAGLFRATSTSVDVRFQADQVGSVGLINVASNHPLAFNVNATEQMRLTSTGLGIGTSSPNSGAKLTVAGGILTTGAFSATSGSTAGIDYSGGYQRFFSMGTSGSTPGGYSWIAKGADGTSTTPMTLDTSGRLMIGNTGNSYIFSVQQNSTQMWTDCQSTYVEQSLVSSSGTNIDYYLSTKGTGNIIWRQNGTTERARITASGGFSVGTTADPGAGAIYATGNITAYYSSDAKFKENVQDIPDALEIVTAIGSKTFDWTDEYLGTHGGEDEYFQPKQSFGVIAQDVQKVFPQAVRTRTDGSLAVDYEKLAILSFGAIGQLLKRVEALESK